MPLPTPILDDRSYQQLRDELVQRIPVYNPEWTDHNPSDPGITLIELFAFLGENLLYRFNQIPDATRLAFLRLLDIPLRAAVPAEGMVSLKTRLPGGELVEAGSEAQAGELPFQTQQEVDVLPVESAVLIKLGTTPPEPGEETVAVDATKLALGSLAPTERIAYYRAASLEDPTEPGARPLPVQHAVDGMLWIAVLRTRHTVEGELGGRVLNIGYVPEQEVASMDVVDPCDGPGGGAPSPAVIWQATTGAVQGPRQEPRYQALKPLADTTRGLTRAGVIRLELPEDITELGAPDASAAALAGAGDLPPVIEDPAQAARVLFWLRVGRLQDRRPLGAVRWVGLNAAAVVQLREAAAEYLGTGTGQPFQERSLLHGDIVPGSVALQVEESKVWQTWTEVTDFAAAGPDDRYYTLDAEAGLIRFGEGLQGRPPQLNERIRVLEYRHGGGAAGNVPANAIERLVRHPAVEAANPLPTRGGADAETLESALERVPGEVRRRDRAVTSSDFEELALETPGAGIGRAETIARFHPPTRREEVPGVVTVVVWPREDPRNPDAPVPDRATLRSVCRWLDARRLITTELWVVPPTYRKIAVAVGIQVKPDHGIEAVRRWVELVIRQYLAPLPPYGPEGRGWPLGRRVHGPELEAAVLQVAGVAYLEGDLRLAVWDSDAARWLEDGRTIPLQRWEVPALWEITVVEGQEPLEPGAAMGPLQPDPTSEPPGSRPGPAPPQPPRPGTSVRAPAPGAPPDLVRPVTVPVPVPRLEC